MKKLNSLNAVEVEKLVSALEVIQEGETIKLESFEFRGHLLSPILSPFGYDTAFQVIWDIKDHGYGLKRILGKPFPIKVHLESYLVTHCADDMWAHEELFSREEIKRFSYEDFQALDELKAEYIASLQH